MPEPIRPLTLVQFVQLLTSATLSRAITSVHLHHTWRPRHADFRGLATIEAMRAFHMQTNGWSDIAQHLTIDPLGGLWTGRNWNTAPASSKGQNGDAHAGPFMIEMVGDFDKGQDPFGGAQKAAAIDVVATLLSHFTLKPGPSTFKFHNQLGSPKTCPGTSINYKPLLAEIANAAPVVVPRTPGAAAAIPHEYRIGASVTRGSAADAMPVGPASSVGAAGKGMFTLGDAITRLEHASPHDPHASRQPDASGVPMPMTRTLLVYTQDPATRKMDVSVATIDVPYEPLGPGPTGAVIRVIDQDATSHDTYEPLDLDRLGSYAPQGVPPSTTDPRFAQQMTYAVAMNTYDRFRQALGRTPDFAFPAVRAGEPPDPDGC